MLAADGSRLLSVGNDGNLELRHWQGARIWQTTMPLRGALAISNWLCLDDQGRAFAATDDRRLAIVSPAGELERSIGADGNEETWTGVILLLRR